MISDLESSHALADVFDFTGELAPENPLAGLQQAEGEAQGQPEQRRESETSNHRVFRGDGRSVNPYQHLIVFRAGLGDFPKPKHLWWTISIEHNCFH